MGIVMTYVNAVFDVEVSLTDRDIQDICVAIETVLKILGINPDIADTCVRVVVGPESCLQRTDRRIL